MPCRLLYIVSYSSFSDLKSLVALEETFLPMIWTIHFEKNSAVQGKLITRKLKTRYNQLLASGLANKICCMTGITTRVVNRAKTIVNKTGSLTNTVWCLCQILDDLCKVEFKLIIIKVIKALIRYKAQKEHLKENLEAIFF